MSHPWTPFLTYLLHRKTRERTTVTGLPFVPALGFELEHLYLGAAKMLNHMRLYLGRLLCLTTELDAIRTRDYYWIQLERLTFIRIEPIHDNLYSLLCAELLPSYPDYGKHRKPFTRLSHGSDLSRIPQTQSRGQRKHGSIPEHHLPGYFTCRWARAQALVASSTTTETSLPIRSPPSITTTQESPIRATPSRPLYICFSSTRNVSSWPAVTGRAIPWMTSREPSALTRCASIGR